jgi:predicted DsbA family dithiol-disulfide isomerase
MTLEELFAGRGFDVKAAMARLSKVAAELELPFGERTMTYNSRRAQEMGKFAEAKGRGEAFHDLAFRAYFAGGQNIAEKAVLKDIAAGAGLDPDQAWAAVESGEFAFAVDADWQYSRRCGVSAVPSFLLQGRMLVGAQPYPRLAGLVQGEAQVLL